ncbi:hypothetical protein SLE2022_080410 [Rubroshorea leprosula]
MAFRFLLSLLSVVVLAASTVTANAGGGGGTITVPLSPFTNHLSSDPYKILNNLATASISRARHLKRPKHEANNTSDVTKASLYPHSYGGYSISLGFGTPPQTLPFLMDTGSSLVWFPCTSRYVCSQCAFPNRNPSQIHPFLPKLSSSSKVLGCKNPKCAWIFGSDVGSRCKDCDPSVRNCTQACPPYILQYGSGLTGGVLMLETLDFSQKTVPNFLVGCSVFSMRQPAGVVGFGRSPESLPSQMGLNKFSYCLVSRRFDDKPVGSTMVLESGSSSGDTKTKGLSYTPFHDNPVTSNSASQDYFYVTLRKIIVGDKPVKVPYRYLVPGSDGNGGTIVDSGSTFTFMERPIFLAVAQEFVKQMGNYSRATSVEFRSGLSPCFNISGQKSGDLPELIFHFKGGAKMALPVENYFAFVADSSVICLTVVTDNALSPGVSGGPAIILGSFQQQNYYVEYDLLNKRLGFAKQSCV